MPASWRATASRSWIASPRPVCRFSGWSRVAFCRWPTSGRNWSPARRRSAWRRPRRWPTRGSPGRCSDSGLSLDIPPHAGKALFHGHCHQKALVGAKGTVDALQLVRGLDVTVLDAGCCGMAGAFGYEKQHYDLSVQIANLELIPAVQANPAATVIATGTSCRHQIRDLTGRAALHPLEVLAGELCGLPQEKWTQG